MTSCHDDAEMKPVAVLSSLAAVAVVVLAAIQFVPPEFPRDNPPVEASIEGPQEVVRVLRRACYDCHSNETEWPFYAWVAPASWWVTEDVAGGRSRLNLSEWEELREAKKRRHARKIVERTEAGEMPMPRYLLLHPGARLSEEELALLRAWRDELEETAPAESTDAGSSDGESR